MLVAFPAPVLSVTADAVRELEGGEALSGLWTLFTKCKESLKDGRRLENISWRLWYRELMLAGAASPAEPRSVRYNLSILPLLPLPEPTTTKEAVISATESLPTPDVGSGYVRLAGSSTPVSSSILATSRSCVNEISPGQVYASPPSPSLSEVDARGEVPSNFIQLLSSPAMALVTQQPLSTTSPLPWSTSPWSTSANPPPTQISIQTPTPRTPPPPTLVVVNPMPNLTPHPTPPATPAPVLLSAGERAHGQYLTLPGRAGTLSGGGGSVRNSGGRTSAGEVQASVRLTVVEHEDDVEARLRKDGLGADDKNVDAADSDDKPYHQHHQKYNSNSLTASSSSVTGTTGVASASAQEGEHVISSQGGGDNELTSTRDDPSHSPADPPPTSASTNHSHSQSRSPTTTARSRALCSTTGARNRSRPPLSVSGVSTKSKSRSRDAGGGALALGMTKKVGGGGGGGGRRSRVDVGIGGEREALNVRVEREYLAKMREGEKELEIHNQCEGEREREREGRRLALFNINSHSDNGSKRAAGGSDVSGLVAGVHEAKVQGAYELAEGGAAMGRHEAAALKSKGKEREEEEMRVHRDKKEKDNFKAKLKEREEAMVAANLALAAQQLAQLAAPLLPQQLAAALLPQQQRRTIVLATSESDYENDSDDDEDGSWSSEEIGGAENIRQVEVKNIHQVKVKNIAPPPPPPEPAAPPPIVHHRLAPIQKTVSNHTTSTRTTKPLSRTQIHRAQAQANTQAIMEKAAAEAQRQQNMFAQLPIASSQNLARGGGPSRTRSAGLLTQLLNPPSEILPLNHPYRRGNSSGKIRAGQQQKGQGQAGLSNAPGPSRAPGIQVSKSAAALPISSQVQVGSMYGKGVALGAMPTGPVLNGNGNVNRGGRYRPKGRPQGQELEDDSGSEDEANAGIQVSKSVAQEGLKALAHRRGIVTHGKQKSLGRLATMDDNIVPPWALGPQPPPPSTAAYSQPRRQVSDRRPYPEEHPPTPTPIPVEYPYNLPPPAAPSTPRTTRRQMLHTEMSESMRRNLLWERQMGRVDLVEYRASTNGGSRNNMLGGLKPLMTMPSVVQLRPKGEAVAGLSNAEQTGSGAEEREERRQLRNRSWADDYHFKGW